MEPQHPSLHIRLRRGRGCPLSTEGADRSADDSAARGRALAFAPLDQPAAAALQDCAFMAGLDPDGSPPCLRLPKPVQAAARDRYRQLYCGGRGTLIALLPAHNPQHSYGAERLWDVGQRLATRISGTVIQRGPASPDPAWRALPKLLVKRRRCCTCARWRFAMTSAGRMLRRPSGLPSSRSSRATIRAPWAGVATLRRALGFIDEP